MKLTEITTNSNAIILALSGHGCDKLRDLGFCEKAKIKKICEGRIIICDICSCKIAISRELGERIEVQIVD